MVDEKGCHSRVRRRPCRGGSLVRGVRAPAGGRGRTSVTKGQPGLECQDTNGVRGHPHTGQPSAGVRS